MTWLRRRSFLYTIAGTLVLAIACLCIFLFHRDNSRRLPYRDNFARSQADEWQALGGTWAIDRGVMQNDSDERGAKLLAGSTQWTDYILSADVKLLERDGDAGLIVRSSNEELGVDSYSGYYAGLRTRDNRLVLGRANHDWKEVQSVALQNGTQAFRWYNLEVVAFGCTIAVSAAPVDSPSAVSAVSMFDKDCFRAGRIGLRSYSSGGAWKNIRARVATQADLHQALAHLPLHTPNSGSRRAGDMPVFGSGSLPSTISPSLLPPASSIQPINSIRLATPESRTTVRGVVVLTKPAIFVQDSSGGAIVTGESLPHVKIGDEVQVTGELQSGVYSTRLHNAAVTALWSHNPVPPVSITSAQAASGAFDSMFVEMEGTLLRKTWAPDNRILLEFEADQQPFEAMVDVGRADRTFRAMEIKSRVRLRGVCVVDPEFTHQRLPFVLLMPSSDDLEVLSGPPWWNAQHILLLSSSIIVLILIAHYLQSRVEQWRWRTILDEREKLAHEIHDTLAQSFAGLGFQLEAIRDRVPEDIPVVHEQLDLACDLVRRSHQEARRSIVALRRNSAEQVELLASLEVLAHRMVDQCGVLVETTQSGDVRALPPLSATRSSVLGRKRFQMQFAMHSPDGSRSASSARARVSG